MGWSSIVIGMRYVHPSNDAALNALERLQIAGSKNRTGSKSGSNVEKAILSNGSQSPVK